MVCLLTLKEVTENINRLFGVANKELKVKLFSKFNSGYSIDSIFWAHSRGQHGYLKY